MKATIKLCAVAIAAVTCAARAADYYVDAVNGDDSWDGSCAISEADSAIGKGPRRSLAKVMELVTTNNNDVVHAAPGVYGSETVSVDGVAYRVAVPGGTKLVSSGSRDETIILGAADPGVGGSYSTSPYGCGPNAVRCGHLGANSSIDGFVITGGRGYVSPSSSAEVPGGIVGADRSTCFVYNSVLTNLVTNCRAAAMYQVKAVGCYFANNRAATNIGDSFQMETVYNCVFGPAPSYHGYYKCYFYNCTFVSGKAARSSYIYNTLILAADKDQNNYYNCLYTTAELPSGTTSSDAATRHVDAADVPYDPVTYAPLPGSLVIGAGNNSYVKPSLESPYADYLGNPRVYDGTVDVGAVEGRPCVTVSDVSGLDMTGLTGVVTMIQPGGLHATIARNYNTVLKVKGIRVNGGDLFEFEGETADRVWEGDFSGDANVSIEVVYVDKNDWYVDAVHGDDSNDGYTPYRARRTLKAAMALPHLTSGEVVHAAAGTYDEGADWTEGGSERAGSNRVHVVAGVGLVATNAAVTFIKGTAAANESGIGKASVRCVFLEAGSWVENFTITNGYARGKWSDYEGDGGGIWADGAAAAVGCRIVCCRGGYAANLAAGSLTLIRCYCGSPIGSGQGVRCVDAIIDSVVTDGASVFGVPLVLNSTCTSSVGNGTTVYNSYVYYDAGSLTLTNSCMYFELSASSRKDETSVVGIRKLPNFDATTYRPARTDARYCDTGNRALYDELFPAAWVRFKGCDFAGGQRVYNAKIDIGAGEADWREVYTAALDAHRIEVVEAGPGVTAGSGSLNLPDGESLVFGAGEAGTVSLRVSSEGTVVVTSGGSVAVRDGDVYTIETSAADKTVTVTVSGAAAVVSDLAYRANRGMMMILR